MLLDTLLKEIFFSEIICFEPSNFQPSLAHMFIMDMKLDLINRELGAHTNIIKIQKGKISMFVWTHPGTCSMGENIANQCHHCWCLKTTIPTVNQGKKSIIIKCVSCRFEEKNSTFLPAGHEFLAICLERMSMMPD